MDLAVALRYRYSLISKGMVIAGATCQLDQKSVVAPMSIGCESKPNGRSARGFYCNNPVGRDLEVVETPPRKLSDKNS